MIESARLHLVRGLQECGLSERYIQQEVRDAQQFPTGWAAYLYPVNGRLKRSGARVRIESNQTTRWLWTGVGILQLELFAPDEKDLAHILQGLLTWMFDHPHISTDNSGLHMELPTEGIGISYQLDDGESVLQMRNGVRLNIPVEVGVTRVNQWVPISIKLEGEIVGGGP